MLIEQLSSRQEAMSQEDAEKAQQYLNSLSKERWHKLIEKWAYALWQKAGEPTGHAEDFWCRAEEEMFLAKEMALEQLKTLYWKFKYEELQQRWTELQQRWTFCVDTAPHTIFVCDPEMQVVLTE